MQPCWGDRQVLRATRVRPRRTVVDRRGSAPTISTAADRDEVGPFLDADRCGHPLDDRHQRGRADGVGDLVEVGVPDPDVLRCGGECFVVRSQCVVAPSLLYRLTVARPARRTPVADVVPRPAPELRPGMRTRVSRGSRRSGRTPARRTSTPRRLPPSSAAGFDREWARCLRRAAGVRAVEDAHRRILSNRGLRPLPAP